ncbi:uncharacterized protein [Diadema setosum]|uniref:uncharacterized protein isoform X1 n=2 Tax=Diadema setosum TaxID=31175 RepID=UPI003B3A06BF
MLTRNQATKLLRSLKFKDDPSPPKDSHLASAPKSVRLALIRDAEGATGDEEGEGSEQRSAAAIEIQRQWRGFLTRCRLFEILDAQASVQCIRASLNSGSRDLGSQASPYQRSVSSIHSQPHTSLTTARTGKEQSRLNQYYNAYCTKAEEQGKAYISFEDYCAHIIQSWWHHIQQRQGHRHHHQDRPGISMGDLSPMKSASSATKSVSIIISPQTGVLRGEESRGGPVDVGRQREAESQRRPRARKGAEVVKKKRTTPLAPNEAASIIQQAWRRHIDVQVYRYYRDLINFRCRGNPAMMLRCINPKEASLLDAAAGIHIKFRLAGAKFPPNIYYKIFTHRPIIDMCANSPKDYTAAPSKRFAAKDVHNRRIAPMPEPSAGPQGVADKTGWYQRTENNGWRLVSDRLILRADQDPVTWDSSKKKVDFPHSRLQRREDVEKKKKRKKLEWMKKMYQDGMLQATSNDQGLNHLVEDATDGMMATLEIKGPEQVDDWEVDELLQWTSGLNFDDYQKSWQEIATSAGSETFVDERLKFKTSNQDPFEFSLTMDSLPSAPSPSRATTANVRTTPSKPALGVSVK